MKRLILLVINLHILAFAFGQQAFLVKGTVSSSDGENLIGVNVGIQGTPTGTITDADGNYQLTAKPGDKIEFAYIGFKKEVITVKAEKIINVTLVQDQASLDEVVVVAYGQVKRITMTGAVSAIAAKDIRTVPTSSVQNALSGRLPGFFSQQTSGQPGKDASDFFIRGISSLNNGDESTGGTNGNRPLIIVDDVQYSYDQLQQININEIESISILKDASTTAIYGIKGANGVLIVKTRRGALGTPQINFRAESGISMPVRTPKFLNSYQAASLVNEAYLNDGLVDQVPFTDADLELFKNGQDPYGHPDVNWYDKIFKKIAYQENVNMDIGGGTEKVKYFITGGYFTQNGLVRNFSDPHGDVNTNYFYRRFNLRTNLDFTVSKTLSMRLDMSTRFMNINEPSQFEAVGQIYDFSKMRPYSAPFMNQNGTYAYNYNMPSPGDELPTLNARLANEGYNRTKRYDSNVLFSAVQKLDFITRGLFATVQVAYSSIDENVRKVTRGSDQYPSYHYDSATQTYMINPRNNKTYAYSPYGVSGQNNQSNYNTDITARLNHVITINKDHTISSMLMFNRQSEVDKENVPANFESFALSGNYNYKNKYLADLNIAYNGTDRFAKNHRYGIFPALGLAYNIAEEDFFHNAFSGVQMLKLRASLGLVGSDIAPGNRYIYKQVYVQEQSGGNPVRYPFSETRDSSGIPYYIYYEDALGNDHVTWEKDRKLDFGVDANFLNKFSLMFDVFADHRYDQLVTKQDVSLVLGQKLPPTNSGITQNRGFDGQVGYQDKFGQVHFFTNFVFSYAKNKIIYMAEPEDTQPWLRQTGRPIGQPFGYTFVGYYTQEEVNEINAGNPNKIPVPDVNVKAGDLKYKDLNGDGIINDYDKGAIGKPNLPTTNLGLTIGGNYRNFSLSVLFQGAFDYSFDIKGTGIESFQSQFQPVHLLRWTQDRFDQGMDIEFPRLTTLPSTVSSSAAYPSDYWLLNAFYIRLKTVDLSYQIPAKTLHSRNISGIRLYASAYNLFTHTNYKKYQQDPEIKSDTAGDAYMNQKVINFGVQLSF